MSMMMMVVVSVVLVVVETIDTEPVETGYHSIHPEPTMKGFSGGFLYASGLASLHTPSITSLLQHRTP